MSSKERREKKIVIVKSDENRNKGISGNENKEVQRKKNEVRT